MREILLKDAWVSWMESYKRKQRPISVFINEEELRVEDVVSSYIHREFQEFNVFMEGGIKLKIIGGEKDAVLFPVPVIYATEGEPEIRLFSEHAYPMFPGSSVIFSYYRDRFYVSAEGALQWMELSFWIESDPKMRRITLGQIPEPFEDLVPRWPEEEVSFSFEEKKGFFALSIPMKFFPLPREIMTLRVNFKYNGFNLLPEFLKDDPFCYYVLYFR